jgi:hypothetical protein
MNRTEDPISVGEKALVDSKEYDIIEKNNPSNIPPPLCVFLCLFNFYSLQDLKTKRGLPKKCTIQDRLIVEYNYTGRWTKKEHNNFVKGKDKF